MSRCQFYLFLSLLALEGFQLLFPGKAALLQLGFFELGIGFLLSQIGLSLDAGFLAMDQAVQVMVNGHGCLVETAQFFVICCQVCQEGLSPLFRSFQFLRRRLFFGRRRLAAVFDFRQESFTVAQFLQGQGPFIGQSFAVELTKLLQRFGLLLQGFQLLFKNAGQVADAFQIAFRFGNFSQAFGFSALKAADAGHFFKDDSPFFGLTVQDAVDTVLADDGHRILTDTGVGQEVMDILQAARPAVDIVFAVAGAEQAPGDDDFRKFRVQGMVAVIKIERYFGRPLRPAGLRTGKDDIFSTLAPQLADILFPHDPADGVGNVALAAAVRPDDGRHALIKVQSCLIGKGFEASQLHFQ